MSSAQPDAETLHAAIAMAIRAPSVHNSQPWRWRINRRTVDLYADPGRHLVATDPQQRGLVLSCGAALHHFRVALAMLGWSATVTYLPDSADADHLATVEFAPHEPAPADFELSAAILHRQSDRRRYSSWQIPAGYLRTIASRATHYGAAVRHVPEGLRASLARPAREAAARHAVDHEYQLELAEWSGRRGTPDGVPAVNSPRPQPGEQIPVRAFAEPDLPDRTMHPDAAEWLVVCTAADDRTSRVHAGEAISAALLTATDLGLSSCLQTEPLGLPELRADIRTHVLYDCAYPQAMVRVGWVPTCAAPLPQTPRRPVAEVIDQ
ncbi:Acg family FMN-binding oxidoreductase [Nocardia sp. XZ_19_385]|uniref:Acg family FMN-binding oxidoreductase n=1 Tax=Nocardia sp. XZ_19_385 TaxID=2769488 RepID=UPI0018905E6B|nr:NAD(P)H nitroreductase [Nocardia sp. XZ_19_385]